MAFSFRKTLKVMPGVKLNISKSGLSITLGGRGKSINLGKKGVYVNSSIPGTGLSYRRKISSKQNNYDRKIITTEATETEDSYLLLRMKVNEVGINALLEDEEARFLSTKYNPSEEMLLFFSGIFNGEITKILLTDKKIFLIIPKKAEFEVVTLSRLNVKNIIVKKGIFFQALNLILMMLLSYLI